jgi:hypothetical protein
VPADGGPLLAAELRRALDGFDEPAAEAVLDRHFAGFTVETALRQVLVPYLRELGERWAAGAVGVAAEHRPSWPRTRHGGAAAATLNGRDGAPRAVLLVLGTPQSSSAPKWRGR